MENDADILILGAGAAGLAAARELSDADLKVIVLEARDRIGGRINTHFDQFPIELGAEFVHGKPPETLQIVERAKLTLQEVPNPHWHLHNGVLTKSGEFWSKVEEFRIDDRHREVWDNHGDSEFMVAHVDHRYDAVRHQRQLQRDGDEFQFTGLERDPVHGANREADSDYVHG